MRKKCRKRKTTYHETKHFEFNLIYAAPNNFNFTHQVDQNGNREQHGCYLKKENVYIAMPSKVYHFVRAAALLPPPLRKPTERRTCGWMEGDCCCCCWCGWCCHCSLAHGCCCCSRDIVVVVHLSSVHRATSVVEAEDDFVVIVVFFAHTKYVLW